ncbi:LysR family transcriptional regulator [Ensifer sp.]|uniref:helix-turn-helix domain-containing protein n=1 Tax=Ensifer sp. TaxID=1872086 RepID=UPI0032C219E1
MVYFQTVVELLSIRECARRLNVASSAVSRQIGQLEDALGMALFLRENEIADGTLVFRPLEDRGLSTNRFGLMVRAEGWPALCAGRLLRPCEGALPRDGPSAGSLTSEFAHVRRSLLALASRTTSNRGIDRKLNQMFAFYHEDTTQACTTLHSRLYAAGPGSCTI